MGKVVSSGVVILNGDRQLFACHTTGTSRWDLPKGIGDPGEADLDAAVRETWEETSLQLDPATLTDLGVFDYLPQKRLHLFALRVATGAFDPAQCRCHSTFPHRVSGKPVPEVDGYAWQPADRLQSWCGKNLGRVLAGLDWTRISELPELPSLRLKTASTE